MVLHIYVDMASLSTPLPAKFVTEKMSQIIKEKGSSINLTTFPQK